MKLGLINQLKIMINNMLENIKRKDIVKNLGCERKSLREAGQRRKPEDFQEGRETTKM